MGCVYVHQCLSFYRHHSTTRRREFHRQNHFCWFPFLYRSFCIHPQVESRGPSPPDALSPTPPPPPPARRPPSAGRPSSGRSASDNETAFIEDMQRLQAAKAKTTNVTRSLIRHLLAAHRESEETLHRATASNNHDNAAASPPTASARKSILKNAGAGAPSSASPPHGAPSSNPGLPPADAADELRLRPETGSAMKCACCFTPRSAHSTDQYCHTCGTALPPLLHTQGQPNDYRLDRIMRYAGRQIYSPA